MQRVLRTLQHTGDGTADPRDGDACGRRGERRRRRRRSRRGIPAARRSVGMAGAPDRSDTVGASPRRRLAAPGGGDPQRRRTRHHPRRSRCRRIARRADPVGRNPQRADRACAARQGLHRIRQPLRRRHDRSARIRLWIQGDQGSRRAADARHRFSLPAVLSRQCEGQSGRHPWPQSRSPHPDQPRAARHRGRHPDGAAAAAAPEAAARPPGPVPAPLPKNPQIVGCACRQLSRPQPHPAGIRCGGCRSARCHRRGVHLRCGAPRWCGRRGIRP